MNKNQLVSTVSQCTGMPKYRVEEIITATINAITDVLAQGDPVKLIGFGKFDVKERAARTGRNPKKNVAVHIPAMWKPVFIPGKDLKEAVTEISLTDIVTES